jgi:hypothetical protein
MKLFILVFLLILEAGATTATSPRGKFEPLSLIGDTQELNKVLFSDMASQNADLKKIKYYLINGETNLAKLHLSKIAYTQTKLKPIIFRYLGMVSFMENEFEKSLEYLSLPQLQSMPNYQKICTLKILNLIVLDKKRDLSNEWPKCLDENLNHFKASHFDWLKLIVDLKLKPYQGITTKPFKGIKLVAFDIDQIKMILKMALYLNQEKIIEEELSELTSDHYQDPEIRELLGQISFRLGQFKKSYRFVEGLESPNAENIKGNLYILRKKYELAYAQFKLALQKKLNSQNAMERILPLAWFLGDWEEGAKVTEKVIASPQTQINKLTLLSAFYAQKGDYEKARQTLEHINSKSRKGQQVEVTQIYSFVGLMENKPNLVKNQARLSCDQYDLVNCWIGYQMERWDAFPLVVRREDKISYKKDWQKLSASKINDPIKEQVFVNQLDIEELDDKLIKLIPDAENN